MNNFNIFIQLISGFIVTFSFSIFFNAPKKSILICSTIGAMGWLVYIFSNFFTDIVVSTFLGAVCVGLVSSQASKYMRMPATIFIYTGIIPLVPGYGVYSTMQSAVTKNYFDMAKIGVDTILQAGAIAMGILVAAVFSDSIKRVKIQRRKK